MKRCPRDVLEASVAACRPVEDGLLIALKDGEGARIKLVGKNGVRWERALQGKPVFQDRLFVVLETKTIHRALWLSPTDGSTTRSVEFVEQPGPAPFKSCDDRVLKWFRSAAGTVAAICLVLD